MRTHAIHLIATVDVALDLIDDPQLASDTAVVLLAQILRSVPAAERRRMSEALTFHSLRLLEHIER